MVDQYWYFPATRILTLRAPTGPEDDIYLPDEIHTGLPYTADVKEDHGDGTLTLIVLNPAPRANPGLRRRVKHKSEAKDGEHYYTEIGGG